MMLAPTMHGHSDGPRIIFDVNYSSGTILARAAQRLRDHGNKSMLVGIVLNPLLGLDSETHVAGLDHVCVEHRQVPQL